MGHNGCDGSQASGPWVIGSGYRFTGAVLGAFLVLDVLGTNNAQLGRFWPFLGCFSDISWS